MSVSKALFNQPKTPNRIVLLGGGGFMGRHLATLFDKNSIPYLSITHQDLDLTLPTAHTALAEQLEPNDVVILLSTLTPRYGRGTDVFVKNIHIAQNVCTALKEIPPSHLIYLSSDAVYPFNGETISEESAATPTDLYGMMHRARELMLQTAINAPTIALRSTLVYGAGDPHNSYGPNRMRRSARDTGKISLFGKGEEMRDHIYIDDLTHLILKVIQHRCTGNLNLVTGQSISYFDLAHKVAALFEEPITIETSSRQNPITYRHFNNLALRSLFPDFTFTNIETALQCIHQQEFETSAV